MSVTREELAEALEGFYLWIRPDWTQNAGTGAVFGTIEYPELVAEAVIKQLSANAAHHD